MKTRRPLHRSGARARRIVRRRLAEAREKRKAIGQATLALTAAAFFWCVVLFSLSLASPRQMVEAQIVRGKGIKPATSLSSALGPPLAETNVPSAAPKRLLPEVTVSNGEKYANLSFVQLASFPFEVTPEIADANSDPATASARTRAQLPELIKALNEKAVALTGFMLPTRTQDGLASEFLLLRNQSACCYGTMPRINEWVIVEASGKGVKSVMDVPVTALGKFHVGEQRDNGHLLGIYRLDCDRLIIPTR